jgi:hypothetical protein
VERVAFLIERTGDRLGCLLNPESVVIRRSAGIKTRRLPASYLTGAALADDPLLFTGGGRTLIDMDLLFDVTVAGSSIASDDVRDLTRPLWALSENAHQEEGYGQPPVARLIWGKSWNIPVVVMAVSQRLEYFTPEGTPRRSWLRIRLARVSEPRATGASRAPRPPASLAPGFPTEEAGPQVHELIGGGPTPEELGAEMLPGLGLEARDLEGATTASDIVSMALMDSGAWAALLSARDTIGAALDGLSAALAREGEEEKGTPPSPALEEGAASMAMAMETVFAAVKGEVVGAMAEAAATISSAADDMAQALEEITEEARATIAPHLEAALERIRPAVAAIESAAQRTVTAIRAHAATVIRAASDRMEQALFTMEEVADDLATGAARLGSEALEFIRSSLEVTREALREMQATGDLTIANRVPAALKGLAAALDSVWAAGQAGAAMAIETAVSALALGLRSVWSASEAVALTLSTRAAEMVESAAEAIRSAMAEGEADAARAKVEGHLGTMQQAIRAVPPQPLLSDALAEMWASQEAIAQALRRWTAEVSAGAEEAAEAARDAIETALDRIVAAADTVPAREEEAFRERARAVMAAPCGVGAAEGYAPRPGMRAIEAGPGERLDHLALQYYGDASLWRMIAAFNDFSDPLRIPAGTTVRIPPASAWRQREP